jgi:hypothetical protein
VKRVHPGLERVNEACPIRRGQRRHWKDGTPSRLSSDLDLNTFTALEVLLGSAARRTARLPREHLAVDEELTLDFGGGTDARQRQEIDQQVILSWLAWPQRESNEDLPGSSAKRQVAVFRKRHPRLHGRRTGRSRRWQRNRLPAEKTVKR